MNKNKLHDIKDSGFKRPKNYFDGMEDSIMNQIKLQEKVEDTGFIIPDNYLESLDDKILGNINHKPKVISLFTKRNLFYASGIAAALALMFSIFIDTKNLSFDDLETASIENYLSEEDYNSYDIASFLTDDELITDNFIDSKFTDEALENYLLQNTIIEDLIIE